MRSRGSVWVVVLGDFGRSPRMQYHTLSLSEHGYDVQVIATGGSRPIEGVLNADNVHLHLLPEPPPWLRHLPALLALAAKAAFQLAAMMWLMLARLARPRAILLQNPPAIPTMLVCWAAAARHRAALIVDWHNLAYTILALKHGRRRWLIHLARGYEALLGARAAGAFTVTAAMQRFLASQFGVAAHVLHDRPPAFFQRCSLPEAHELLARLEPAIAADAIAAPSLRARLGWDDGGGGGGGGGAAAAAPGRSLVAEPAPGGGGLQPRARRPALVVSSTSWTPDEDFGLLLDAAVAYDAAAAAVAAAPAAPPHSPLPDVLFVVTGRGPQRAEYLARMRRLELRHVAFCSLWLEAADYPRLLGAADLGVCLHTSSSGLDLPMKVVDMFGAGLPVCAVDYPCITELITPGRTGLLFRDARELAAQLQRLLSGFSAGPAPGGELARLRAGVAEDEAGWRWADAWDRVAAPVFAAAAEGGALPAVEVEGGAGAGGGAAGGTSGGGPLGRKAA